MDLINARWQESKRPIFLSQLRLLLRSQDKEVPAEALKVGLRDYLQSLEDDRFQVVRETDASTDVAWALAPGGITREEIFTEYRSSKDARDESIRDGERRFHRAVWTAFHIPIQAGETRYLNLEGRPSFKDVSSGSVGPDGWFEISSDFLPGSDDEVASERTEENLRKWLRENEVSIERVQVKSSSSISGDSGMFFSSLSKLSESDLSRIKVPLDIIVKALRK